MNAFEQLREISIAQEAETSSLRAEITRLQAENASLREQVEKAREALDGSAALIDRLLHVHVAPDECTSYVEASRRWFHNNGGTLACIAEQQAANRRALKDKEERG